MQVKEHNMGMFCPAMRQTVRVALMFGLVLGLLLPSAVSAAPTQSTPGSERWLLVYTVRPGDTLSEIALRYGVTIEALMAANDLRNPNRIVVGQDLIVPEANTDPWGMAEPQRPMGGQQGGPEQPMGKPAEPMWEPEMPMGQAQGPMEGSMDGPPAGGPQRPMDETMGRPQGPMEGSMDGPPTGGPQRPMDGTTDRPQGPMEEPMDGPQRPQDGPVDGRSMDGPQRPKDDGRKGSMGSDEAWKGSYYRDKYFGEFVAERKDPEIRFNWYTGRPFDGMPEDRFSIRWEKGEFFREGWYRFTAVADDGVRVYVDDQLIIDGWKIQPATEYKGDVFLREGRHKLVVEYYEEAEDAQISVSWEPIRR